MSEPWLNVQTLLRAKGYGLGSSGPDHDGVDGNPGDLTGAAVLAELLKANGTIKVTPPAIALIDAELLHVACPERSLAELAPWVEPIRRACLKFEINAVRRVAAFIAQMAHESGMQPREENLNYRAERLCQVWPARFPNLGAAVPYAHNPERLANRVYASRLGNGDEASGDGWKFRGVGPLQITGRANMTAFGNAMGMSVEDALTYAKTMEGGIMAAAWFWEANDINRLADTPGVADETRRINGGEVGLADRTARFDAVVAEMLRRGA
jgi:putative chitinase